MERFLLALTAGVLMIGLVPVPAAAYLVTGVVDQKNEHPTSTFSSGSYSEVAQTFTVGKTGLLDGVDIKVANSGAGLEPVVMIQSVDGSGKPGSTQFSLSTGPGPVTATLGWAHYSLDTSVPVTAGQKLTLIFDGSNGSTTVADTTDNSYGGGMAYAATTPGDWQLLTGDEKGDLAFRTYVDPMTNDLTWDKSSITAGASASLTLTATVVFPTFIEPAVVPDDGLIITWEVKTDSLPAWFAPSGVTCSAQIDPANCKKTKVAVGGTIPVTPNGDPITIAIIGTGNPAAADTGTATAKMEGCLTLSYGAAATLTCATGEAAIGVAAAATPAPTTTPPPTSTSAAPSPGSDFPIGLLPPWLLATVGVALTVRRRSVLR